jgi:uncharacterized membrane protein
MHTVVLFAAAFLAAAVEMVEALTIVLAVGVTRGWRAAASGMLVALVALTFIIAVFGQAITRLPIDTLRLVVGTVLLVFGLQWLRKAILRASGLKALHDEDAIFRNEIDALQHTPGHDWYGFTISFKGVFLEGLEVAFLVVTFGGTQHNVGLAALASAIALVAVGIMLTSFGIFWAAEGAGADWPAGDASILVLLAVVCSISFGIVAMMRRSLRVEVVAR